MGRQKRVVTSLERVEQRRPFGDNMAGRPFGEEDASHCVNEERRLGRWEVLCLLPSKQPQGAFNLLDNSTVNVPENHGKLA